jgi:hypothetical protein
MYLTCTLYNSKWIVCLKCNLRLSLRCKRTHFDPIFGCRIESMMPTPTAGVAPSDNIVEGDHGVNVDQEDTMSGDDTMTGIEVDEQQEDSHSRPLVEWRLNSWSGDPGGLGSFLSKQSRAYFNKEMKKKTMGNHFLVQQAFNTGVQPQDLSKKEVKFHLNLCSIFHGIT